MENEVVKKGEILQYLTWIFAGYQGFGEGNMYEDLTSNMSFTKGLQAPKNLGVNLFLEGCKEYLATS